MPRTIARLSRLGRFAAEVGPGDVFVCPPGHDAWIVGKEACVAYDFSGAATYAKKA